ncbi:MAG TPA: hypothetical protein PLJ21_13650, partial [Pseudobdellovibrionaceae bacterium]|nr:hypothetical protein [Pseudobdellovibrionaceae bacterium]
LFSSSHNGVYNIYKSDYGFQKSQPLTHSLAGYFNPDFDPLTQDLIVTEMTENGPQIALIKKTEFDKTPEAIPYLESSISVLNPALTQTAEIKSETTSQDYSPYEYLVPQYWFPLVGGSSTGGGWILTAQTSGHDPIGLHNYSLIGILDTATNKGGFLFSYLNQTTETPYLLSQTLRNTYLGTVTNEVTDQTTGAYIFPNIWSWNQDLKMSVGWSYNLRSSLGYDIQRTGPGINLTYTNYTQQGLQISPVEGWGSSLNMIHFLEFPGYFSHSQFTFSLQKYFSYSSLPQQHAILARLDGTAIPQSIANYHGTASSSSNSGTDTSQALFLIRGYTSGEFYGRNMVTTNLEYRFPISYPEKGWGLVPFFAKRLSGAVVIDGLTSDGRAIHKSGIEILDFSKTFWSTGIEAKLDTTVGYVAPLTFILGLYKPLSLPDGSSPLSFSFNFLLNQ